MERVMVTLPVDLLQSVDALARRMGRKRSQVVRQALQDLLEKRRQQEFEELMAEGYRTLAHEAAALAADSLAGQAAAAEGLWRWDE